jgi:thiamine-monophosphate kinase
VNSPNSAEQGGEPAPADKGDTADRAGEMDEFAVIDQLRSRFEAAARTLNPQQPTPPPGDVWIGDDAAVLTAGHGSQVWATDLVVEGVHVDLHLCTLDDMGFKALMVAASDLAAMGAMPASALVSIAAPPGTDVDALGRGVAAASVASRCVVVGGDLSRSRTLMVSVSVLGGLRGPERVGPMLRSGACAGHHLMVTGPLGRSSAGLRILRQRAEPESWGAAEPGSGGTTAQPFETVEADLSGAYRRPVARLEAGETGRLAGASAAIDVSDGLASDLRHLGRSSGVGIDLGQVPVADGANLSEALGGGEDYELVMATSDPDRMIDAFRSAHLPIPIAIGRCTDRADQYTHAGRSLAPGGWRHRF